MSCEPLTHNPQPSISGLGFRVRGLGFRVRGIVGIRISRPLGLGSRSASEK